MRVACALFESRRAEEIALNHARSGAPISRDATERQSAPPELTVAADREFESAFLQQTVSLSREFAFPGRTGPDPSACLCGSTPAVPTRTDRAAARATAAAPASMRPTAVSDATATATA